MWQHAFPELIETFEGINDADALNAYIAAIDVAGAERVAAENLADDVLEECEKFAASRTVAEARLVELADEVAAAVAAEAERKARKEALGFKRPTPPPPAAGKVIETTAVEIIDPVFQPQAKIVMALNLTRFKEGQVLTDRRDQAEALYDRAKRLQKSNTGEKFTVLRVEDYIDPSLRMPEDGMECFRFLMEDIVDDDALTAGFCAPATIDLAFCGGSPSTRPVQASLRRYMAPRGRVRKINTPLFSDVGVLADQVDTTGIGFWTNADDDDTGTKTCSIVTCPTDEEFELYATYRCIVIKNLMQLAFPEWVAWYLQQLDAHWARAAEIRLLDAMYLRAGAAITTTATYGALATFISRLNQLMNNYVENERYDDAGLAAWIPRWVKRALKDDAIRRGQTLTDGQINSALADIGITRVTWHMDEATAYTDLVLQAKGVPLEDYPVQAPILLSRADNLRLMDFGAREIGITTDKVYRDTTTNLANNFQMFVESFEGVIDMGCPTWLLEMPICGNGLIAPVSGYGAKPCGAPDEINDVVVTG